MGSLWTRLIKSQMPLNSKYFVKEIYLVIVIIRLTESVIVWPEMNPLSGVHCPSNITSNNDPLLSTTSFLGRCTQVWVGCWSGLTFIANKWIAKKSYQPMLENLDTCFFKIFLWYVKKVWLNFSFFCKEIYFTILPQNFQCVRSNS
jgi:hypothetical protein